MTVKTRYFQLGSHHSAQEWATIVATLAQAERVGEQTVEQTYLDTVDWSLWQQGIIMIAQSSAKAQHQSVELLGDTAALSFLTHTPLTDKNTPKWPRDFPAGQWQSFLSKTAGYRSFLPLASVCSEQIFLQVRDKKGRERVRLRVEVNFQRPAPRRKMIELGCRLRVDCLAGYEKDFAKTLPRFDGLPRANIHDDAHTLMSNAGRVPLDYSSKLAVTLDRTMRADEACKVILLDQFNQIERSVQGAIDNIDTEFLHDLRVAVRRCRSLLSRVKNVLPVTAQDRLKQDLSWLGKVTGPVRDLDVYLLTMPDYRAQLRPEVQGDLDPLQDHLLNHYDEARADLVAQLQSPRFKDFLARWRRYLQRPLAARPTAESALVPIGQTADSRIWKAYKDIRAEGSAITADSPAEALHDLRKTCKKLRYSLEFFSSLYPKKAIKAPLKALKTLQENLGEFQDLDVQAEKLHHYSAAMINQGQVEPKTYLAMGVLVEHFMARKAVVREEFATRFAAFTNAEMIQQFKALSRDYRVVEVPKISDDSVSEEAIEVGATEDYVDVEDAKSEA